MKTSTIIPTCYRTISSRYSLEPGEIGNPIGDPVITEYPDGPSALRALESEIDSAGPTGMGRRLLIRLPDGRELPFDGAYHAIFGEPPVYRDNRSTLYPRLKSRRQ